MTGMTGMRFVACALVAALAVPARANPKGDAAAKKGKKLLADKHYPEACAAFEKGDEVDPGIAAKLNVASCYEEWGKLATALRWYRDAEKLATDAKDKGLAKIHERRAAVDDDTPRLTLRVAKDADATAGNVLLDGQPAKLGEAIEVDPGPHVIEYTSEAGERKKKTVPVERGGSSDVKLDLPRKGAKHDPIKPVDKHVDEPVKPEHHDERSVTTVDPGKQRKMIGLAVGGGGLIALGFAGYFTLDAHADYKAALDAHCGGVTNGCDAVGLSITHRARTEANYATVVAIVGTLAIAGGVVLYLTAPRRAAVEDPEEHALYLAPSVDANGGGIVFGGRY